MSQLGDNGRYGFILPPSYILPTGIIPYLVLLFVRLRAGSRSEGYESNKFIYDLSGAAIPLLTVHSDGVGGARQYMTICGLVSKTIVSEVYSAGPLGDSISGP
eukprot:sb/3478276/